MENKMTGVSVVISTFHTFTGCHKTSSAAQRAFSIPCGRANTQAAQARSSGNTIAGTRMNTSAREMASKPLNHHPTIGGWS